MSSRLYCWTHGHDWAPVGSRIWSDLFGNRWKLQPCRQCGARRRVLHKAWGEPTVRRPDYDATRCPPGECGPWRQSTHHRTPEIYFCVECGRDANFSRGDR